MNIEANLDLTAVGRLASRLRVDVDRVLATSEALGIVPVLRVDRVVYFDREQADQIAEALK